MVPNDYQLAVIPVLFSPGGIMGKILDWLMGVNIISIDDAVSIFQQAITQVDTDENGYLNLRELISIFKRMCKHDGRSKNGR